VAFAFSKNANTHHPIPHDGSFSGTENARVQVMGNILQLPLARS